MPEIVEITIAGGDKIWIRPTVIIAMKQIGNLYEVFADGLASFSVDAKQGQQIIQLLTKGS